MHPFASVQGRTIAINYIVSHSGESGTLSIDQRTCAADVIQLILRDSNSIETKLQPLVMPEDFVLSLGQWALRAEQPVQDAEVETDATLTLKFDQDAVERRWLEQQRILASEKRTLAQEKRKARGEPKPNERTCKECGEHRTADQYSKKDWGNSKRVCEPCHEARRVKTKVLHDVGTAFRTMDLNNDRKLSREEWIAHFGDDKLFHQYDTNGDGVVDSHEFTEGELQRRRAEWDAAPAWEPSCLYRWLCCLCHISAVVSASRAARQEQGVSLDRSATALDRSVRYNQKMLQVRATKGAGEHCVVNPHSGKLVDVRQCYEVQEDALLQREGQRMAYSGDYVEETKQRRKSYSASDASGISKKLR